MERISIEIENSLKKKFKSKVSAEGKKIKEVLTELIKNYCKEPKNDKRIDNN